MLPNSPIHALSLTLLIGLLTACSEAQCADGFGTMDGQCQPLCTSSAECSGATPICDTNVGQCVGCLAHTDCSDPTASSCNLNNVCVGCTNTSQCSHLASTPVCNTDVGTCVACTNDAHCGATACKPDHTCGTTQADSVGGCQSCEADGECESPTDVGTYRCLQLSYTPDPGYNSRVCVLDLVSHQAAVNDNSAACPNTTPSAQTLTSLNGTEALYCVPRAAVATCEAILSFSNLCPNGPSDCNAPGALCRDLGPAGKACTYACTGGAMSRDCPTGSACDGPLPTTCDPN